MYLYMYMHMYIYIYIHTLIYSNLGILFNLELSNFVSWNSIAISNCLSIYTNIFFVSQREILFFVIWQHLLHTPPWSWSFLLISFLQTAEDVQKFWNNHLHLQNESVPLSLSRDFSFACLFCSLSLQTFQFSFIALRSPGRYGYGAPEKDKLLPRKVILLREA